MVNTVPKSPQNVVSLSQSTYSPVKRIIEPHVPLSMSGGASTVPEPPPHQLHPVTTKRTEIFAVFMGARWVNG
jgi:hypothetical protein